MDATPFLPPEGAGRDELAEAAQECRGCPLWKGATRAVMGEGPLKARVVLVGEQGLFGRSFRVTKQHGELIESDLAPVSVVARELDRAFRASSRG